MLIEGKKIDVTVIETRRDILGSSIYLELEQENDKAPFPDKVGEVRIFLTGKNNEDVLTRLQKEVKKTIVNFK